MPSSGPSKEELENYWKSSRQYFDELAGYYKESDPQYYNEYIAPFYRFRLSRGREGDRKSASPALTVAISVALLLFGLIAGLVMMLLG